MGNRTEKRYSEWVGRKKERERERNINEKVI